MKPEIQRIKIAEACGWTFHPPPYNTEPYSDAFKSEALACWVAPGDDFWQQRQPPDYLNDLNACYEMENSIIRIFQLWSRYGKELRAIVFRDETPPRQSDMLLHASAAQRAEAFLRALNLWKEDA